MKKHLTVVPWAKQQRQPSAAVEQRTPTRAADFQSDVLVPLVQAVVTGALTSALITFLLSELAPEWEVSIPKVWLGFALGIAAVAWLVLLGQTRALLYSLEKLTGIDIDRDGETGKPQERLIMVNAARAREQAQQCKQAAQRSELATFVAQLPAKGTDARAWEPLLGRETYEQYRNLLLELGWAQWNSPRDRRRGWSLVVPVREALQRMTSE